MNKNISGALLALTDSLCARLAGLAFGPPVTHVYNPLVYARRPHETYVRRFGNSPKRVLFLGMNPGPYGMAQTGVPFGEISVVRDWMGIEDAVGRPADEHPKRRVEGFACKRSEVSGRRLWGLFAERFGTPEAFFAEHFVLNFCPLVFMEDSGRNRTPDKLPTGEIAPAHAACDDFLRGAIALFQPEWVVGVGGFAEARLAAVVPEGPGPRVGRILHPSPASPAANRGWSAAATRELEALGIWRGGGGNVPVPVTRPGTD